MVVGAFVIGLRQISSFFYSYNLTGFSASEVLDNHTSVLTSFGIDTNDDELDFPYIYWIPKMHKKSL